MLRRSQSWPWRRRNGNVGAIVALSMPVLIGVTALGLDAGILYVQRRQAQTAAEAAALAGVLTITNGGTLSAAQTAAVAAGSQNGITVSASQVTQPQTGYIAVSATSTQPKLFSALWGAGNMSATATATARGIMSNAAAIIVLAPSGSNAFTVTGNGGVNTNGGSIVVNSSDSKAATITGSESVYASEIDVVGNYSTSGSGAFVTAPVANNIKTGVTATPDPLSGLPVPNPSSLTSQTYTGQTTLQPGYYSSGISFSGSSGTITLQSGIYYINGGFGDTGNANIVGTGVMIYNASQSFSITGNGNVTLSPMSSGTYAGITIFHNRTSNADVSITGNGNLNITGTIYAADAKLTVTGNGSTVGSRTISNTLVVTGNGSLNMSSTNRGITQIGLVR
jgi:Flp pilus assembly protein TadG